jgi:hypothetical protein
MENIGELEKKYCVYMHVDKDGVPFYVGHGTKKRAYKLEKSEYRGEGSSRGPKYREKIKSLCYDYDVVIYSWHEDKASAIEEEIELYSKYKEILTNHRPPNRLKILNRKELCKKFIVDNRSPSNLSRIVGNTLVFVEKWKRRSRNTHYYMVNIDSKGIPAHRIIMTLLGHNITGKVIDHIDGDGTNNSVINLRVASYLENATNSAKPVNNKTGITGVSYNKWGSYYVASWVEDGVLKHKYFSIKKYGEDTAFSLAAQARKEAIVRLNSLGYSYTNRHGL